MRTPPDLLSYLEQTGKFQMLRPARREGEIEALCPFHDDKHPSWGINAESGFWNCWSCHEGGTFGQLVERLDLPILIGMAEKPRDDDAVRRQIRDMRATLSGETRTRPHYPLPETFIPFADDTESLRYATKIGLKWDTIVRAGVGHCSRTGGIIYPIPDEDGFQVAWQMRNLPGRDYIPYVFPDDFKKTESVYGIHRVERDDTLVVVEGIKAALLLEQRLPDLHYVSILGSDLSIEQARILGRVREIILLLDGDDAGRRGAKLAAPILREHFPGHVLIADLPVRTAGRKDTSPDDYTADEVMCALGKLKEVKSEDQISEIRGKLYRITEKH